MVTRPGTLASTENLLQILSWFSGPSKIYWTNMPREGLSSLCFTESFSWFWGMLKSENNLPSHMLCAGIGHLWKFPFDFFLLSLNFDVQGPGCTSLCTFLLGLESHLLLFILQGAMSLYPFCMAHVIGHWPLNILLDPETCFFPSAYTLVRHQARSSFLHSHLPLIHLPVALLIHMIITHHPCHFEL